MNPDVAFAVPVLYAEAAFTDPAVQEPPLHPWLARDWKLHWYVLGTDALWRERLELGGRQVFYGYLLESLTLAGTFVLAIRGTDGVEEWAEDAEGLQRPYPRGGRVEDGFAGVAGSLVARLPGSGRDAPLIGSLAKSVGSGRCVGTGHSLGGAVITLVAPEMADALLNGRTALRVFASPHPGDEAFCRMVAARVPDQRGYVNQPDLVPRAPPSLPLIGEYASLPNLIILPAGGIKDNVLAAHHLVSYVWKMAGRAGVEALGPAATPYLGCIVDLNASQQAVVVPN